jgi:hypothetical protein
MVELLVRGFDIPELLGPEVGREITEGVKPCLQNLLIVKT